MGEKEVEWIGKTLLTSQVRAWLTVGNTLCFITGEEWGKRKLNESAEQMIMADFLSVCQPFEAALWPTTCWKAALFDIAAWAIWYLCKGYVVSLHSLFDTSAWVNSTGMWLSWLEHRTVTPLKQVRFPGAARDFSPCHLSLQTLLRVSVHTGCPCRH